VIAFARTAAYICLYALVVVGALVGVVMIVRVLFPDGEISAGTAAVLAWGTLILWFGIAVPFFATSVVVHIWTRDLLRRALVLGNGKIVAARRRLRASRWYLLGSGTALALALWSGWVALNLPIPPPDTRAAGAVTRIGICIFLLSFFMTKIQNLLTFIDFESEAHADIRETRDRVREIQSRGQHDQPAEEADRSEGQTHRHILEEAGQADRAERKEERRLDREERAVEREVDRLERRAEDRKGYPDEPEQP
jgi:hypothetical protein